VFKFDRKLETRTDYAAQIGTTCDLESVISAGNFVMIQVMARHALSGFSKVFREDYGHLTQIVPGAFCSGNTFKIIKY
jgi:hypothetical protein